MRSRLLYNFVIVCSGTGSVCSTILRSIYKPTTTSASTIDGAFGCLSGFGTRNSHISPNFKRTGRARTMASASIRGGRGGDFEAGEDDNRCCSTAVKKDSDHEVEKEHQQDLPELVLIGDAGLLSPCEPYDDSDNIVQTILDMKSQLDMLKQCQKKYGGIGIAACQVGWRARVFCMGIDEDDKAAKARYPDAPDFPYQFWINPTITTLPEESGTSWFWEGCLSVPGMRGWVERANAITISGYNERGEYISERRLEGLPARVAQHEYDHLDGILFPFRALPETLLPVLAFAADRQEKWPQDWPTPGARNTRPGSFSNIR